MLAKAYLTTEQLTITLTNISGTAVTGATVAATVVDFATGDEVAGQTWPVSLDDQSDGTYTCLFEEEGEEWDVVPLQMVLVQVSALKDTEQAYAELETQVQVDRS